MALKCEHCKKKSVGLMPFSCKCGLTTLCCICKYPEEHKCTFDYKNAGKQQLEKLNPKIEFEKLIKI